MQWRVWLLHKQLLTRCLPHSRQRSEPMQLELTFQPGKPACIANSTELHQGMQLRCNSCCLRQLRESQENLKALCSRHDAALSRIPWAAVVQALRQQLGLLSGVAWGPSGGRVGARSRLAGFARWAQTLSAASVAPVWFQKMSAACIAESGLRTSATVSQFVVLFKEWCPAWCGY